MDLDDEELFGVFEDGKQEAGGQKGDQEKKQEIK